MRAIGRFMFRIIRTDFVIRTRLLGEGTWAIALYPFIFVNRRNRCTQRLLLHERIHLAQQRELLILPFYIWYALEYGYNLLVYRHQDTAYRNISFEREAYYGEQFPDYLLKRRTFAFFPFHFRRKPAEPSKGRKTRKNAYK